MLIKLTKVILKMDILKYKDSNKLIS